MALRWLAVAVAFVHAAYLVYLVVGGYLAWRLPRTFWLHLLAAGWGFVVVAASLPCPLTTLQNLLREHGGQQPLPGTYLDVYVRDVVYPAEYQDAVYVLVALAVAVSWVGVAVRYRRRRAKTRAVS